MRILFLATRLAGTDGVSLEAHKLREVLARRGHDVRYCAGELPPDDDGHLIPEMHFTDAVAQEINDRAFSGTEQDTALDAAIARRAAEILALMKDVVSSIRPALLVVQNAWAIPVQLPLALALAQLADETELRVLAHNHDYWWERERFAACRVKSVLERFFPYHSPRISHLSINSAASRELSRRRGIASRVLHNVLNFEQGPPPRDAFSTDFRQAIGVDGDRPLLLQPTRVVPRKGIELAVALARRLSDLRPALVITHGATDEGHEYLDRLRRLAADEGVDLRHVDSRVALQRSGHGSDKVYSLWDAYHHADLVTFPSLYEGFGNALLEAVWFRRPLLVNRYDVYKQDIGPKGFAFIEIDGAVDAAAEEQVRALLPPHGDAARARELCEQNYAIARAHFGYAVVERVLDAALAPLGLTI